MMKKLVAIMLAVMLVFAMVACDTGSNPDSSSNGNLGVSQSGENKDENSKSAELIEIQDTDIRVIAADYMTILTGDDAAVQKAKIPAEIKKGVGEIGAGLCTMTPDYNGDGTYSFGATFYVPKDSFDEYWKVLTDYYKSLEGTVTSDSTIGSTKLLEMEFSWGEMYQCEGYVGEEQATITVSFNITE